MTTESQDSKTSELQHRRKLRLLQVREQSKDIAKKIRQRAKVEESRQLLKLDHKKKKQFLQSRSEVVRHLEQVYSSGRLELGAAHRSADDIDFPDVEGFKEDLSRQRARTAAAELRHKKQQVLDEQKKILDRRLQAREAANELSRDKTKVKIGIDKSVKTNEAVQTDTKKKVEMSQADIGIQCPTLLDVVESDFNIPPLELTSEDQEEATQDVDINTEHVSGNKVTDLFAVSDDMPSSLRNTQIHPAESEGNAHKSRPALTMVSDFLQQRSLRLREPMQFNTHKDNLQDVKKTIDWSRKEGKESNTTLKKSTSSASAAPPPVTAYEHATRTARPAGAGAGAAGAGARGGHVTRAAPAEDAYARAARESAPAPAPAARTDPRLDEMRHKIAMNRKSVEREYNDTISFLNSIPKTKSSKPFKTAFMDESRQKLMNDMKQHKMQCEFKDIQKDSIRQASKTKSHSVRMSSPPAVDGPGQYSWLPVPEGEAQLAVHTLRAAPAPAPARPAAPAPARSVEFADGESYRYRSRHKHTPPTKDRHSRDDSSSAGSHCSDAVELLSHADDLEPLSESKKIIIYKVVKSRKDVRKTKSKGKASDVKEPEGDCRSKLSNEYNGLEVESSKFSLEQVDEGVYRTVSEKGDGAPSPARERPRRPAACPCRPPPHHASKYEWSCGERCNRGSVCHCDCGREYNPHCSSEARRGGRGPDATPSFASAATEAGPARRSDDAGEFLVEARDSHSRDSFEVVIQLKKKNMAGNLKNDNLVISHADKVVQNTPVDVHTSMSDTKGAVVQQNMKPPKTLEEPVSQAKSVATASTETECVVEASSTNLHNKKDVCDKAVSTSFHVSASSSESKQISEMKQCRETQTSLITPGKPALQVSSSSTAYMSPPEFILPHMRHGEVLNRSNEEPRRSRHRHKHTCSNKKSNMQRLHTNHITSNKDKILITGELSNKQVFRSNSTETGSGQTATKNCKHRNKSSIAKNVLVTQKIKKSLRTDIKSRNKRANLNPVVKGYVNTLLNLSKDGLKVLQVLNQDCSTVNTPSSSIMNTECNFDTTKPVEQKISLEQLKHIFEKQIYENLLKNEYKRKVKSFFNNKRKTTHKLKLVNTSKEFTELKSQETRTRNENNKIVSSSSAKDDESNSKYDHAPNGRSALRESSSNLNIKSSSISKYSDKRCSGRGHNPTTDTQNNSTSDDVSTNIILKESTTEISPRKKQMKHLHKKKSRDINAYKKAYHATDSDDTIQFRISDGNVDECYYDKEKDADDIDRMKIAQDKLQNIEKIADLTEQCTIRLSNLAKVLEKVRKNKSTYSQISATDSSSDTEPKRNYIHSQNVDLTPKQTKSDITVNAPPVPEPPNFTLTLQNDFKASPSGVVYSKSSSITKTNNANIVVANSSKNIKCKPPAALSRIHFKPGEDDLEPHELSTVIEVDSPMSVRNKNVSKQSEKDFPSNPQPSLYDNCTEKLSSKPIQNLTNPDLLPTLTNISKDKVGRNNLSLDTTKLEMMDLNKFKQIMLAPFVSLEEFAKQCHVSAADDDSNIEDALKDKDKMSVDELSSLNSEGSLPDVISELLKRNIIKEPFKFATMSNVNSLTSDSSFSTLALSRLDKGKSINTRKQTEKATETSDTLSFSSNPDLENAFKKLGIGWASSTLKKTKERLALSSSSNSSSRSGDYHPKTAETHMSETSPHRKQTKTKHMPVSTKDVDQQTSRERSMTVQEFLTTELAKKITFSNNTPRDWSDQEFVTLCETKMPEEMKAEGLGAPLEVSAEADAARARTSTPVQIFKKPAYHSSSSSNNYSNGLFSNMDDLSSVKVTSSSIRNHSTSDKDSLTIPSCSLKLIISKPSRSE